MLQQPLITRNWFIALFLGLIFFIVYFLTLTRWYSGDDLQWILHIESSVNPQTASHPASPEFISSSDPKPSGETLQPRYLLEMPTSSLLFELTQSLGLATKALWPILVMHAVAGALGVVFFFTAIIRILPRNLSIILSIGFGASYAWWYYSTHPDYTILSHTFSALLLLVLTSLFTTTQKRSIKNWALILGIANALVTLYLMTGIMLVPAYSSNLSPLQESG